MCPGAMLCDLLLAGAPSMAEEHAVEEGHAKPRASSFDMDHLFSREL